MEGGAGANVTSISAGCYSLVAPTSSVVSRKHPLIELSKHSPHFHRSRITAVFNLWQISIPNLILADISKF